MEAPEKTTESKKRNRLRFSLKALLVLALLVACSLGAFRLGREQGFDMGQSLGFAEGYADGRDQKVYPTVYRLSDILSPAPSSRSTFADYQKLIAEVESEVHPASWESVGGPATLAPYPQNLSLVVSHTQHGHEVMQAFLEEKRKGKEAPSAKVPASSSEK